MRLARILGAVVALVLAVTMGSALVPPAQAVKATKHEITGLGGGESSPGKFFIKGKVATFPQGRIKVLRNVAGGSYRVFKKTRTRASGKFRTSISQVGRKKTCFKIQVPARGIYKKTTSPVIGCITSS